MTNEELITKIKAEIERLKVTNPGEYNYQNVEGYVWALDDVLSFLSTLESEKPIPNDLEEAAKKYAKAYTDNDNGNGGDDWEDDIKLTFIAGAKWIAEHTPLHEDTVLFNKGVEEGKRLMMEEAVKTRVIGLGLCDTPHVVLGLSDEFKDGDKVRIIIVKENEQC